MKLSNNLLKIFAIATVLIVPSIAFLIISTGKNNYQRLEIFGPREPGLSNSADTIYHTIAPFILQSHLGESFSSQDLEGKIFVADFFFATCQTICPKMTMQMKRIQQAFINDSDLVLISHTVDPVKDTVEALAAYAAEYGAVKNKWFFLTGDKKIIYDLARYSYFLNALEGDGGPDDFIHSEKIVLVDKEKRIRGYYDGTDYEDINLLIDEIKVLKLEYETN
jgi:protein SCO1/2